MAWQTDREPIEYLERRHRYYKRKRGSYKRLLTEPVSDYQKSYFGSEKKYLNAVQLAIGKMELRMSQYSEAIEKLKSKG